MWVFACDMILFCFTCCSSYFWLHFLKREQKQTFPWYCLLTKTKLSFLYVFLFYLRDLQITMVNFFIFLHSLDAMRTILYSFCFVCNETSAEWERVLHLPRLNAELKLQTTFTNSWSSTWRLAFRLMIFHCSVCKIVLLHNHYNHNYVCI